MDINKKNLSEKYISGDMDYVFRQAKNITDFLLVQKFKIKDAELREDMAQECLENLWKKIECGKCDPNKNIFAFIWQNSTFRILEILRKERKRKQKVNFIQYDDSDENNYSNFIDSRFFVGNKYSVEIN